MSGEDWVAVYEAGGKSAVFDKAKEVGVKEWSVCVPCDDNTPRDTDHSCLVCGTEEGFLDDASKQAMTIKIWFEPGDPGLIAEQLLGTGLLHAYEIISTDDGDDHDAKFPVRRVTQKGG